MMRNDGEAHRVRNSAMLTCACDTARPPVRGFGVRSAALLASIALGVAGSAGGTVIVRALEVGNNVVLTGSGSLDISVWRYWGSSSEPLEGLITPDSFLFIGPGLSDTYRYPENFTGPSSIPVGDIFTTTTGRGDRVGIYSDLLEVLTVPAGYQSGEPIFASSTWLGESFASMVLIPGTELTWTWGEGGTADSFVFRVVPAPSTAGLLGLGLFAVAWGWRRSGEGPP